MRDQCTRNQFGFEKFAGANFVRASGPKGAVAGCGGNNPISAYIFSTLFPLNLFEKEIKFVSTVIINSITGNEIFIFGDTIVTKTNDQLASSGITTHGEEYHPLTNKNGEVVGFSESACKVGILCENTIVGMAGSAQLGFNILESLFEVCSSKINYIELNDHLNNICNSLSPSSYSNSTSAELLFAISDKNLEMVHCHVSIDNTGTLTPKISKRIITPQKCFQKIIGLGNTYLNGYIPRSISDATALDNSLISVGTQMLCMDYSKELRKQTRSQAAFVGGAFLGLMIDKEKISIPKDTISIVVNNQDMVEYLVKTSYAPGLFIITDFIRKKIQVVRTIDEEVLFRKNRPRSSGDITSLLYNKCSFTAPIVFCSSFENETDEKPFVSIYQDQEENVLRSSASTKGFSWLKPSSTITLKNKDGTEKEFQIP